MGERPFAANARKGTPTQAKSSAKKQPPRRSPRKSWSWQAKERPTVPARVQQSKAKKMCKAAAKAMKKTFGIVTKAIYPKGCFFLNNKVYFNPGKTGRGHGAASPVCVSGATVTKKPSKKLFLAASGKANCAGKGVAVKNENGCKAAAKAMKKDFTGSRGYPTYPKGCFVLSNKFYYNNAKTGKGNSKARPVCVSGATVTKKPTKKLVIAGNGKANCAGKGAPVKNEAGCRAAAKAMKRQFGGGSTFSSYPMGCFVYNTKLYFNKGKTGKGNSKASPVCVSGATGGKKTTPKKKPANPCAKNNGGCAKARKCMNVKGKAICGKCPKGYTNSGTKQCKKATATKKPAAKLVLAGIGKASCSGKGAAVKNENACKAAAKAMKKTFGIVTNARYPKGCFFLNNKVYFNPGKTGRGHGAASPVCVATAGATKKPAKKLVLAATGKPTCAGKGVAVKNENGCKAAAKAMKKDFTGSRGYPTYPKGCFVLSNKFYYNNAKTGKGNSKARPVCVTK